MCIWFIIMVYEYSICMSAMVRKFRHANKTKKTNLFMKRGKTMKKFSKIALSVAAVSAVTVAMAVSASAAMTATYNAEAGTVTLSDVTPTGQSQTLLVLDKVNLETVADTNIKQIDQKDDSTSFETVKVGELKDGTYEVRIGGSNGGIQTATFTVGEVGPEKETETIILGDVSSDKALTGTDVSYILRGAGGETSRIGQANQERTKTDGTKIILGDVSSDDTLTGTDVSYVLRGAGGETSRIGQAGQEVEVYKVTE